MGFIIVNNLLFRIEYFAAELWDLDYPNGGSIFPTFESTMELDKKLYRYGAWELLNA